MKDENGGIGPLRDHRFASSAGLAGTRPFLRGPAGQAVAWVFVALMAKLIVLLVLDRPFGCGCGQIWSVPGAAMPNSRTLLDPYSLQHLIAGAGLVAVVRALRPDWAAPTLLAAAVVSGAIWEMAENLPASIALFGYASGDPLAYDGDSVLNSMADTGAAGLGAALALPAAGRMVALAAAAVEIAVTAWIGDGFIQTIGRMIAG